METLGKITALVLTVAGGTLLWLWLLGGAIYWFGKGSGGSLLLTFMASVVAVVATLTVMEKIWES
jgi:hypothetical protein